MKQQQSTTLVLGATGSFGGAVAAELISRGQSVRVLVRDPAKLEARFGRDVGWQVILGDVQDAAMLGRAAEGCDVIVHGINYPYDKWFPNMETATRNILVAATANDATIVFPGNIYSLGAAGARSHPESAPAAPITKKGELRRWMENELKAYAASGGRVLNVRAGDYFGPTVRNGLVDPAFEAAAAGKRMMVLGDMDIPHQWAYMPDLARATVDLLAQAASPAPYEVVHFEGIVARPQRSFFSELARQAGAPDKIFNMPWWLLDLVGMFSPLIREVVAMRYIWDTTVLIEGVRFAELLPDFVPTPMDRAIAETLLSYHRVVPTGETAVAAAV